MASPQLGVHSVPFSPGHDLLLLQMHQLQSSHETCQGQAAEKEAAMQEQLRVLQTQLQEQQERLFAGEKQVSEVNPQEFRFCILYL